MATASLGINASTDDHLAKVRIFLPWMAQCQNGNRYTRMPGVQGAGLILANSTMYGGIFNPARDCTVDRMACATTSQPISGTLRMGIYEVTWSSTGVMSLGAPLCDATVAANATGVREVTFTAVNLLYERTYMLVIVGQGISTGNSTIYCLEPVNQQLQASTAATALTTSARLGWASGATITGALPTNPTLTMGVNSTPLLCVRVTA